VITLTDAAPDDANATASLLAELEERSAAGGWPGDPQGGLDGNRRVRQRY
jgi:hypothetical protein